MQATWKNTGYRPISTSHHHHHHRKPKVWVNTTYMGHSPCDSAIETMLGNLCPESLCVVQERIADATDAIGCGRRLFSQRQAQAPGQGPRSLHARSSTVSCMVGQFICQITTACYGLLMLERYLLARVSVQPGCRCSSWQMVSWS
jgi:hypothetical protein